jgi:hypothetical protein
MKKIKIILLKLENRSDQFTGDDELLFSRRYLVLFFFEIMVVLLELKREVEMMEELDKK